MDIFFLEAARPLTKTFIASKTGLVKHPYPLLQEFTSHRETVTNLSQLEALLKKHAARGHCVLKGTIAKPLVKERRAGSTSTSASTEWIVLDLDGLPETIEISGSGKQTSRTQVTIDYLLDELGLGDVSYIVQWSASYGIENKKLRAHVFMLLDKPIAAPIIKEWLKKKNFEVPLLSDSLRLTGSNNTLSWSLDVSACQNDKLIYIAPPVLKGIKDPMTGQARIQLVKKKQERATLPSTYFAEANKVETSKRVAKLRETLGLPSKKFKFRSAEGHEVMTNPDAAVVTESKIERGFVYFNLNNGDSWAYYHPENNPKYIYNFKGEPVYLTKDLLPEYWKEVSSTEIAPTITSTGLMYLIFTDRTTSAYWRGTYDRSTDKLEIHQARTLKILQDYAKSNNVYLGDVVPEWDIIFDPTSKTRVDIDKKTINLFQPSEYMVNTGKAPKSIPPTIKKVIHHAVGGDNDTYDHFINWLATVAQTRDRTRTAWLFHGVQGTGKGLLINNILRPIFSERHTTSKPMHILSEQYNQFMDKALLVFIDEVQTSSMLNESGVLAKLRNYITEEYISLRAMYSNAVDVRNYSNWILTSNMPDPVTIKNDDRRFNVGKYQPEKIQVSDDEVKKIKTELQAFYNYLMAFKADYELAGAIIESQDRDDLVGISQNSLDTVANAFLGGDMGFFIDQLPTDEFFKRNAMQVNRVAEYTGVLKAIMTRTNPATGACNVSRDEMQAIFKYCAGIGDDKPASFARLLRHHRIRIKRVRIGKTVAGIDVVWRDVKSFPQYTADHFRPLAQPTPVQPVPPKTARKTRAKTPATI